MKWLNLYNTHHSLQSFCGENIWHFPCMFEMCTMVLLTALPMLWQISVKDCNSAGSLWLPPLTPPSPGHYPSFFSLLNLIALQPKPKWDHALLSFCPAYFKSFGFETIRSYSAAHTAGTLCVDQIGFELDATPLLHPSKFWDYRHKQPWTASVCCSIPSLFHNFTIGHISVF